MVVKNVVIRALEQRARDLRTQLITAPLATAVELHRDLEKTRVQLLDAKVQAVSRQIGIQL